MSWATAGTQTNPLQGVVLADTGALQTDKPVGACSLFCIVSCSVATKFTFERRNVDNLQTVASQDIQIPGDGEYHMNDLEFLNGERFRIIVATSIVGTAQASIFY